MNFDPSVIVKEHDGIYNYYSTPNGRSTANVKCPFCKEVNLVYVWSLCGSGKKCWNCKAVIGRTCAFQRLKKEKKINFDNIKGTNEL